MHPYLVSTRRVRFLISALYLYLQLIFYRISGDEEMNIILLRLLEYLGHSNPYISGVSYTGVGLL